MRKCAECGKETKYLKFNHVINRWYCEDCWIKLIGPKSASKAFSKVIVINPISKAMEKQQITNILVPLDGSKNSQRGLRNAIQLANEHKASLTAIHVIHNTHGKKDLKRLKLEEDEPPSFILSAKKLARKNGIPFYTQILTGDPGREIVNYSDSHNVDLIVIGARGVSLKKIFLGSVSNYVMQKSKIDVIVVK